MRSILKRFEVLTVEQELVLLLLLSGLVLAGVVAWAGYHFYQARPCGCVPGDDNTEKFDPNEKVVGLRLVWPGSIERVSLPSRCAT